MRPLIIFSIIAAVACPLVAACGAAGNGGGPSMAQITTTIEKAGFICEVKERHPKTAIQVAQCRASQDKYLILTVSEWNDPEARDQLYESKLPAMCDKFGMKDQVRWSSQGNWLLVAGGSRARDVEALDEATSALGFKSHAVACQ